MQASATVGTSKEAWNVATKQAKEYAEGAAKQLPEILGRLDEINRSISEGRGFAKAHDMQASVQAATGAMRATEKDILERFGADSKEYKQFRVSKRQTLATVQSSIHASYQKLDETRDLTYLGITNEAMWKQNMYTSFQEQQHVDTLRYAAQANDAYNIQFSQYNLAIESMIGTQFENIANWIVSSPSFVMDSQPLITLMSEIEAENQARREWEESKKQTGLAQLMQEIPLHEQLSGSMIGAIRRPETMWFEGEKRARGLS